MEEPSKTRPTTAVALSSGPEVVAGFIESMKSQSDLDPATVAAIAKLYDDKKLSLTNLVKSLEEQRRKPRNSS
jgi:hypothetical protein